MTLSRLPRYYWDIFFEYITGANKPYTGPVATEEELMESRKNAKYIHCSVTNQFYNKDKDGVWKLPEPYHTVRKKYFERKG